MAAWTLDPGYAALHADFGSLAAVFALQGERITSDPLSELIRIERAGVRYYVKRYSGGGKGLRRWLGRPRVKAEWQNLRHFAKWGIPTAPIVAWGLERRGGVFVRGAMITRELPGTLDLAEMAQRGDPRLRNGAWVRQVSAQIATATRRMHDHHFTHNDLKWRNLLVTGGETPQLYLIDCPNGGFWMQPFLGYRIVKDLACLDKVAKYALSRTQRLRFYLDYVKRQRLTAADKRRLRRILAFFAGRE